MRNLIDKYQEKILDLGVGYFDLSGQIGNDRIILNLYESEHVNGLKAGIVLNLNSEEISTFGKGGFDINVSSCTSEAYITCDGDEYLFDENNKNEELGIEKIVIDDGYKIKNILSKIEKYYYLTNDKYVLTYVTDSLKQRDLCTYQYLNNRLVSIMNSVIFEGDDGNIKDSSESINYTYNSNNLCTRLDIYKGNVLLRKIHFEYNTSTNLLSRIYCYEFFNGVQKLSYDYTLTEGLMTLTGKSYIFSDTITGLSKAIKYNINKLLSEITYEDGQYIEINEGTITPSYAITEEEKLKTKVQCYFDANHRLVDIERYNNIHSLRKYEGNKLLLSCDACFKDVNYLGKVVNMRINPECTNGEQLEITHEEGTPDNLIEGLDDLSLFKLNKNNGAKAELYYRLEQHKVYTVIVIVDKNNKGKLKLKTFSFDDYNVIWDISEEYEIESNVFAYSFKVQEKATSTIIEITNNESTDGYVIFNAFVIDKGICNVYEYNEKGSVVNSLVNGVYTQYDNDQDVKRMVNKNTIVSLTEKGMLETIITKDLIEIRNEYDENDLLIKTTKLYDGNVFQEETRTYNDNKQVSSVTSSLDSLSTNYTYNSDYSLSKVTKGNDGVSYTNSESIPKLAEIKFLKNEDILKKHGFTYGSDQILNGISENDTSTYTYEYDSLKRINCVKCKGVTIEEYTYDTRFPDLLKTKVINGVTEIYVYDIFKNIISLRRTSAGVNEVFTFIYNEDNLLTEVRLNNELLEGYQYSYGKLIEFISNGVTIKYSWNELDEVVSRTVLNNGSSSTVSDTTKELVKDNYENICESMIEQDENIYFTTFKEKTISVEENGIQIEKDVTFDLVNKNNVIMGGYVTGCELTNKTTVYSNIPIVTVDGDVQDIDYRYFENNANEYSISVFVRLNSYGGRILFVRTKGGKTYELVVDHEGMLALYRDGSSIYSYPYKLNKYTFNMFTFSCKNEGESSKMSVYYNTRKLISDGAGSNTTLERFILNNVKSGTSTDFALLIYKDGEIFNEDYIQTLYLRFANVFNGSNVDMSLPFYTTTKKTTKVKFNSNYDEITLSNNNVSREGVKLKKEYVNEDDKKYIYDEELKDYCSNENGYLYDLGLSEKGTISFKGKLINNDEASPLFSMRNALDSTYIIFNPNNKKLRYYLLDGDYVEFNINTSVWHEYTISWELSINNEDNTLGYIVTLYIDGERVHNYTYNSNFYSTDNFDVYFNALMIDTLISTGAFRLSSLKFTSSVLSDIDVMSLYNEKEYKIENTYNPIGLLINRDIKYNGINICSKNYNYDNKFRVSGEYVGNDYYQYEYNNKNNLMSFMKNEVLNQYGYDDKNRLTGENINNTLTIYQYDDRDNLLSIVTNGTTSKVFQYDQYNRLRSINGKLVYYESTSLYPYRIILDNGYILLTWQGNRLYEYKQYTGSTLTTHLRFVYDQLGLRTRKINILTNTITYYTYDENNTLILERCGNRVLRYYYDSNNLLTSFSLNGVMYFYDRDVFGNIKHIFDSNNQIVVSYDCKAYGQDMVVSGTLANTIGLFNPFRYKGYYYDVETQLFYCNSRYYSLELCRFIQPVDVSALNPSSVNGLNLYNYANNNPIRLRCTSYNSSGNNKTFSMRCISQRNISSITPNYSEYYLKHSINPLSFSVGLATPENLLTPSWMTVYALYARGSIGWGYTAGDGYSLASFSAGFLDITFSSPKLFGFLPDDNIINPNLYINVGAVNVHASIGVGVNGSVELASGSIGAKFGDAINFEIKGYIGFGFSFDFTNGFKIGVGLGVGFEFSINIDWSELFNW